MSGIIAAIQWLIANWQLIATAFSSLASVALFFMHGNAKAELQEIRDFIGSLSVSQPNGPIKVNEAKQVQTLKDPKI